MKPLTKDSGALLKAVATVVREYVGHAVGDVLGRVKALEERPVPRDGVDGGPGPAGANGLDGTPGQPGPAGERGLEGPQGPPGRDGRDGLPGVPGVPGEKGLDGRHGLDGKDGLGFDDLAILYDGERAFTFRAMRGDQVKDLGAFTIPFLIYRGVYTEGRAYVPGDVVTWAGSTWNANEPTTTKPGEGSKAWTLIVKRGRDGRDGKDGSPPPVPVVKIR